MIQRLAFLAVAALFLLGATSCSKKEEKKPEEDLQMRNQQIEQPAVEGVQPV
ncbi:MAG: hypothetical protein O3A20_05640 [Planctomycetota bacterium]|nr:hypothetical protein [Planctomycetota bacterium]